MKKTRLYALLLIACSAGIIWLFYNANMKADECAAGICLFKSATNIPCPSCGTTRAIISLLHGDVISSLRMNPFGLIVLLITVVTPVWIMTDVIRRRSSVFDFYRRAEIFLQRPRVMIPFAAMVLINWIWNISKGL